MKLCDGCREANQPLFVMDDGAACGPLVDELYGVRDTFLALAYLTITKPVTGDELLKMMEDALRRLSSHRDRSSAADSG